MIAARLRLRGGISKVAAGLVRASRRLDRVGNRALERAHQPLLAARHRMGHAHRRLHAWIAPRARPVAAAFFRALAAAERALRRGAGLGARSATAASRVATPWRGAAFVIVAVGACLLASQFVDYRAVEIGRPGYAGLPGVAKAPTVDARTAGAAHSYLLVIPALAGMALGLLALRRERRLLGLPVAALGLLSLALILLVDLPHGLDAGAQTSRFAGAEAVLQDGFWAEVAAAGGLVLSGLLYYARPCRIRISSSGRAASARRRRPPRRASSRARVARSAWRRRSGAASAPVSPP